MAASKAIKRQAALLWNIAKLAKFRSDSTIPLGQLSDTLAIKAYIEGQRYVDKGNPRFDGGSELTYDLNALVMRDDIRITFLNIKVDGMGGSHFEGDAIKVTDTGLDAVAEMERGWWSKSIEKQPMTYLQVILAVVQIAVTVGLAIWAWHIQETQNSDRKSVV